MPTLNLPKLMKLREQRTQLAAQLRDLNRRCDEVRYDAEPLAAREGEGATIVRPTGEKNYVTGSQRFMKASRQLAPQDRLRLEKLRAEFARLDAERDRVRTEFQALAGLVSRLEEYARQHGWSEREPTSSVTVAGS